MTNAPDRKDWTWVLERPCPECGFDAREVDRHDLGALLRANARRWPAVLARAECRIRPAETVWSALEYAAHVRDVHRVFGERLALMLREDGAEFENWDQDEAAARGRYEDEDPATVGDELVTAAQDVAARYDEVTGELWGRRGLRSNGSVFTTESLGRYHLHDAVHHLHDVDS